MTAHSFDAGDSTPYREPAGEWITVCVRCYRVKRGGVWTDEESYSKGAGTSTGFCDVCFEELRAELTVKP